MEPELRKEKIERVRLLIVVTLFKDCENDATPTQSQVSRKLSTQESR